MDVVFRAAFSEEISGYEHAQNNLISLLTKKSVFARVQTFQACA
jgi:hypothetical protein